MHEDDRIVYGFRNASGGSAGDIDFKLIRCRIVTELGLSPDEVGAMDFPFVTDLLEYWLEFPPTHILLRGLAGYEWKKESPGRSRKAEEMGDHNYRPSIPQATTLAEKDSQLAREFTTGARHLDCAPPHVQQAIERAKKGEHLLIPE
ncbi:MAG: hypothetical protein ACHP6J_04575 [Burkholderiales bacterium]